MKTILIQICVMAALFLGGQISYSQQTAGLTVISAKGTGQTTGHIATLSVRNDSDRPIEIRPAEYYIPSGGRYQRYVGGIPGGTVIPPGQTVEIPVNGYCADVHTPPVPPGESMPPFPEWIGVGGPETFPIGTGDVGPPEPMNPPGGTVPTLSKETLTPDLVVPPFEPTDIPNIIATPNYKPTKPDPKSTIIITWPGTDIPVGGTLEPGMNPTVFAPVIVDALDKITRAVIVIQKEGNYLTPFSTDPVKEREAVIQQTFWVYSAALSGEEYKKEDFANKTIEQFEKASGRTVAALPKQQKEQLESGIDDFWLNFKATGVEAKVIKAPESTDDNSVPVQNAKTDKPSSGKGDDKTDKKEKKMGNCACTSMEIDYTLNIQNKTGNMISEKSRKQKVEFSKDKSEVVLDEIKAMEVNVVEGKKVTLTVKPTLTCTCSEEGGTCPPGVSTVKIMHLKEELKREFTLNSVPFVIHVTQTQTCKSETCGEISCSVTIPIKIDLDKEKLKKEEKENKEKEKEEKKKKN